MNLQAAATLKHFEGPCKVGEGALP